MPLFSISPYETYPFMLRFSWFAPVALILLCHLSLTADEGMWLYNRIPTGQIEKTYSFAPSEAFLTKLRLASVRFNNGGSGSFVSPQGLLFTNHHVASDCIQHVSTAQNDLMKNGFQAKTQAEEKACPDLEVNVLQSMDDVTAKEKGAAHATMSAADANQARKSAISQLEKECSTTDQRCQVVTLYSGGLYHLYRYKKYTDVRLVFAPESDIAAFGGDPDNFTYPRYCLDITFLRAYENGKPVQVANWLPWSKQGVQKGELAFTSGHPGSTGRLATSAQLQFSRDYTYPLLLRNFQSTIDTLQRYSQGSEEQQRVAKEKLVSIQNGYKAYEGFMTGLRDPALLAQKQKQEERLRNSVVVKQDASLNTVWDEIAKAYEGYRGYYKPYILLESGARSSDLFSQARTLLRYAAERGKPNAQRLPEYTDTEQASLEQSVTSPVPITASMEVAVLANYFEQLRKELGAEDETVKALLAGRTPQAAAEAYVNGSKLMDAAERTRLFRNPEAIASSTDPMLQMAQRMDARARSVRRQFEDEVEAVITTGAARVAQARFALDGESSYPDATFTLRLTWGPVKGYEDKKGKAVPYATVFDGLYRRATGKDPFALPPSWLQHRKDLRLTTPFNFVSTHDTHGGNSGSPTVNTKGELVGILFDGNLESLPNRFLYTDQQARSVHVASQGIVEALRKVYSADSLLRELGM